MTAEGSFENPAYDPDWWTNPFLQVDDSTLGPNDDEKIPMQSMQHEKSEQPETSYAETSFGSNKTQPFQPGEVSTPYNTRGEEMQMRLHGQRACLMKAHLFWATFWIQKKENHWLMIPKI